MNKYEKILKEYDKFAVEQFKRLEEQDIKEKLENATSYSEKAEILLSEMASTVEWNMILYMIAFIVLGNWLIEPPILFHGYGHFAIFTHPIITVKQLYFEWGVEGHSFIFSLSGLKHYFSAIPFIYHKWGFFKATFAYLTQYSPVWAFVPLHLLFRGIVDYRINSIMSEQEGLAKYLEMTDGNGGSNEQ